VKTNERPRISLLDLTKMFTSSNDESGLGAYSYHENHDS